MTREVKNKLADHSATIVGVTIAITSAWMTIDWTTFDINKEWPKLVLSAIIAAGGYFSTIKTKE
jgi:hypothetical protein